MVYNQENGQLKKDMVKKHFGTKISCMTLKGRIDLQNTILLKS